MPKKAHLLAEAFSSAEQQQESSQLGMWVFLATEVLFFGALFLSMIVYRTAYRANFAEASQYLDTTIAFVNTAVLLTSSLTMALAIDCIKTEELRKSFQYLLATIVFALIFLLLKSFEYHEDFTKHLFPGKNFALPAHAKLFYFLYYFMTGLHALHIGIGIVLLSILAYRTKRGDFSKAYYNPVEVTGLYWHFVDIVWIFLFPLLYLSGKNL